MDPTKVATPAPLDFTRMPPTRHWRAALSFAGLLLAGGVWCWASIQAFTPALALAWAGVFLAAQTVVAWDMDWRLYIGPVARARQVYGDRLMPGLMGAAVYVVVLAAAALHPA